MKKSKGFPVGSFWEIHAFSHVFAVQRQPLQPLELPWSAKSCDSLSLSLSAAVEPKNACHEGPFGCLFLLISPTQIQELVSHS